MTRIAALKNWLTVRSVARDVTLVFAFAFLTALSAHAKFFIPGTPVPITMQSFTVMLAGAWLGASLGAFSQILLLVGAAVGLPVFATTAGVFGPTGGYFLGFILAALVTGLLSDRGYFQKSFLFTWGTALLASLFIFLPGVVWLSAYTGNSLMTALSLGFWPFLPGDVIKCGLLAGVLHISRKR